MSRRARALSRDEIVDAAMRVIDADGLGALSMRKLGAALGVDAMMIYRHVPDKEALLDLVVERMRSGMVLNELPDNPAAMMEVIFVEYRRVLEAHPHMLPLATRRTDGTGTSGLEFLIRFGLERDTAVDLYQSLTAFTIGFALLGSTAADNRWSGIPDDLVGRLRDWKDETFIETMRAIMNRYGLDPSTTRPHP